MSVGQRLITTWFVIAYLLPMIGNSLFPDDIVSSYQIFPVGPTAVWTLATTFLLFLGLSSFRAPMFPTLSFPVLSNWIFRIGRAYRRYRLPFAVASVGVAIVYMSSGLSRYRYVAESISETGSPLMLGTNVLNLVLTADVFHSMFLERNTGRRPESRLFLENNLVVLALALTANGTVTMFLALAAAMRTLLPATFERLMFRRGRESRLRSALKGSLAVTAVGVVFMGAWFGGETIKASSGTGVAFDLSVFLTSGTRVASRITDTAEFGRWFVFYLIERQSIYYYSFLHTCALSWTDLQHAFGPVLLVPFKTLAFRLDYLTGGVMGIERPEISSVNVLNYRLLSAGPLNLREGSSPGLIAAFQYIFPLPLAVVFCALYLRWLAGAIDRTVGRYRDLSIVGLLLLLAYTLGLFQSPFDLFIVFDEGTVFAALLFCFYRAALAESGALDQTPVRGMPHPRAWPRVRPGRRTTGGRE